MALVSSAQSATNQVELVIEVKGERFKKAVDDAFFKNAKKISVPGFRKGKAPRAVIERYYGKEVFYDEAVEGVYPEAYSEAIDEAGIDPVDKASVEITALDGEGFSFKATVTTRPVAKVGTYKGLSAFKAKAEVSQEEMNGELDRLRESYARLITVEDRPAQDGDVADIDYEGSVGGVPFDRGKAEGQPLTLGSHAFIPGFEEQVAGHSAGEEFNIDVTFPQDYAEKKLAGQNAVFKIKLNGVKRKELPELDDEFAKDISEFDTLDAYKDDLKAKLQKERDRVADAEFENRLVEKIVSDMQVEIPECMVVARQDELFREFASQLAQQGIRVDDFMQYTGERADKMRESFRPRAEQQVRSRLAMEAVAKAETIEISPEQLDEKYKELAEQYKIEAEKLKDFIPEKELVRDMLCNKAIDVIKESAVALDVDPDADAAEEKDAKPSTAGASDQPEKPAKKAKASSAKKEEKPKDKEENLKNKEEKPKRTRKTVKTEE